ncbi:hypothetical protein GIB67_032988 [Kingdonia uniflora]|uniref:DUF659 domain-containing protein n=1 Tax=Kingdonia uniflora TaxID=39325 RepID=A0A7J7MYM2_9MAGN|nr:hypothetical protein GIB67_032988 [Kingdonia uniflora]
MRQNKRSRRQLRDWKPQGSAHDDNDEVEDITDSFGDVSEPDYHPEEGSGGKSQPRRTRSTGLLSRLFRRGKGSNEELASRSSSSSLRAPARHSVDLYSRNPRRETQQTILNMMGGGSSSMEYACGKIASMFYENVIPFNVASSLSYHEAFNSVANYDSWKDKAKHSLFNFLVYCPSGITFLKSVDIDDNRLTADYLITLFKDIIDYVGAENIVQIVTDQGSNFKAAGRRLAIEYLHIYWTACTAHVIDLVLEDTIGDARKISKFVYAHAWVFAKFRGNSNHRDLIHPSLTRFATSFITIRSIMENQVHLQQLFVDTEYRESSYAKLSTSKVVQKIVMSGDFWKKTRSVVAMVEPLLKVLRLVDSDKPTMGYLFDALCTSRAVITSFLGPRRSANVYKIFDHRIHTKIRNRLLSKKLNDLVFVQYNIRLERRREDRRRRYRVDPINVSAILLEDLLCEWIAGNDDEPLLPTHEEWPEELERELSTEDPEVNKQRRYSTSIIDTDFPENWSQAPMYQIPMEPLPEAYFDFDFNQINLEHGQASNYSEFDINQFDSVYQ